MIAPQEASLSLGTMKRIEPLLKQRHSIDLAVTRPDVLNFERLEYVKGLSLFHGIDSDKRRAIAPKR